MKINFIPLIVVAALLIQTVGAYSPDQRYEESKTPRNLDGTGTKLFLRMSGQRDAGVLLRENDRWIETSWSPDSRFLAVIDGSDGHVTDVLIYRVTSGSTTAATNVQYSKFKSLGEIAASIQAPGFKAKLWYHTPNLFTYDVMWNLVKWDMARNLVFLRKHGPEIQTRTIVVDLDMPQTGK